MTPVTNGAYAPALAEALQQFKRTLVLILLGPILWLQGKHVRRVTPVLPEAAGPRAGTVGQGPPITLLIAGDSGAAGVGVASQDEALCGQLLQRLSKQYTVQWQLMAATGLESPGLLHMLEDTQAARFDVVILCIGVNDATALCSPVKWLQWQQQLAALVQERFQPGLLIHSSMPPMQGFIALPQPLRWFMGLWAYEMNRQLANVLPLLGQRVMLPPHQGDVFDCLASDGFHPGRKGYAVWAEAFSAQILAQPRRENCSFTL
jgi:lysophospholipase L1-like esterase